MSAFPALTTATFKDVKDQIALVDFWAVWCGPCKVMDPILEEKIAPQFENVNFYKVNTDDEQDLAIQFGIRSIPTMALIKFDSEGNPTVLDSYIGVQDAFEMTMKMKQKLEGEETTKSNVVEMKKSNVIPMKKKSEDDGQDKKAA